MQLFSDALQLVRDMQPDAPVHCLRPDRARRASAQAVEAFPATLFYAVKAGPHPSVLEAIWQGGVRHFDVASVAEIDLVQELLPEATLAFMHPVKSRRSLEHAWHRGVRIFSLDSMAELEKMRAVLPELHSATLIVRLAAPNGDAGVPLTGKFGATGLDAVALLREVRQSATRVGVSFHVGSQAHRPAAWIEAMDTAGEIIRQAAVVVDIVDVGGGYPVQYPGRTPPPIEDYVMAISAGFDKMPVPENCELWAEPGRLLCADSASVLVRVDLRKDQRLYINDGTYGGLFDAGVLGWRYPMRVIRDRPETASAMVPFEFYGPTCDSLDHMPGPFWLPSDIDEGDYIELGMLGAYSLGMRTSFNGFGACDIVILEDAPPLVESIAPEAVPLVPAFADEIP